MLRSEDLPRVAGEIVRRLHKAIGATANVSVYLADSDDRAGSHYYLYPEPVGFEPLPEDIGATFRPLETGDSEVWRSGAAAHASAPGARSVVSLLHESPADFQPEDAQQLAGFASVLELLTLRHRDLHNAERLAIRVAQADESLTALYEGSFDLSGTTQYDVALKVIELVRNKLDLDRVGLFFRDAENLRGGWGVDEHGDVVAICETVFELHPADPDEVSEAALIARGELEYFLSHDLDGEGHESVEGGIGASVTVPMQVGDRIVGVLAADTYHSRKPIDQKVLGPLMVLANQAATAFENARLYADLREAHSSLERRVEERTAELQQATADKELLLKEVYHRTKNNLQLIVSLLNMQSNHIDDERALKALQDCQSRVVAMSSIHEELYASEDLRAIDFGKHLHALVSNLLTSYEVAPGSIRLRLEADYLLLNLDNAIPLSLIVNELVTNCLKYAFPDGRVGTLDISLHIQGDDVALKIGDDGVGLPDGFDVAGVSTMGLQIAAALASNLSAVIEQDTERSVGAGFRILLPGLARAESE